MRAQCRDARGGLCLRRGQGGSEGETGDGPVLTAGLVLDQRVFEEILALFVSNLLMYLCITKTLEDLSTFCFCHFWGLVF